MTKCKCGCGELVSKNYKRGHARRGRKNTLEHNERIGRGNVGKSRSEESIQKCLQTKREKYGDENGNLHVLPETKLKISITAKLNGVGKWMKGRVHSVETRRKISESGKGRPVSQETRLKIGRSNSGSNNGMFGKRHKDLMSDEAYTQYMQKLSNSAKMRWVNLSDEKKEKWIVRLREQRKYQIFPVKDTKIEVKVREFLETLSIPFMQHKYIEDIKHGYQCDFFIDKFNLVIECDGDYWHNYPNYREIDLIRTDEMKSQGYSVIRLWERDIHKLNVETFETLLSEQHLAEDPEYYIKLAKENL